MIATRWKTPLLLIGIVTSPLLLAGCSQTTSSHGMSVSGLTDALTPSFLTTRSSHSLKDKECLQRAMFFESNRSSRDGMIAVGTVVMNRLRSGQHGSTICEVVGERGQFAPGVLTRPMNSRALPDVEEAADAVLRGERKAKLKNTMYFHTAGLRFPYNNMHYTMVAGGNAFYEKRGRNWQPLPDEPMVAMNVGDQQKSGRQKPAAAAPVLVASAEPVVKTIVRPDPAKQAAMAAARTEDASAYVTASVAPAAPSSTKSGRLAQKQTVVAMQEPMAEPDASRFGGTLKGRYVTSVPDAPQEASMGFQSTPENTDAIGAMIVSQDRPLETN
ncbi:cell wall hydrolase [Mesorhizobium sp. WSM3224]|uniref:cell wall hydrolase n=1 Tax=Mesorhizobium sp. WSM3224 TaxID=1040986 RepID=UPI00041F5E66|nr:cell wall hydrolase [Mesorhizobium sp. WSM3224]